LREACRRGEDWALCPHVDGLPANAEDSLRSGDPVRYWFLRPERGRLRREEPALVLRAALARPLLQLRASATNALRQLVMVGLADLQCGRGAVVAPHGHWFASDVHVPVQEHDLGGFSALVQLSTALGLSVVLWLA
jgi:hypothetical protein